MARLSTCISDVLDQMLKAALKLSNVALRVFPGASSIFNPLTAKTHYDNPTKHGLSGQPYLLNDGDTLEGVGFPTRGHVYLRVEYTLY